MALIPLKPNKQLLLFGVILLVLIGAFVYWNKYKNDYSKARELIGASTKEQDAKTLDLVKKLIEVPLNEIPAIATVSDITKLKNQPFFANAKNGDKVLIFTRGQKAILYRPSTNKIIDVTVVNTNSPSGTSAPASATSATTSATIIIWNGTSTVGITKTAETFLTSKIKGIKILDKDNANGSYAATLVIDLSGKQKEIASKVAKELSANVSSLPKGEIKPLQGDILVILGNNFK